MPGSRNGLTGALVIRRVSRGALLAGFVLAGWVQAASAATITVNSIADTAANDGACTLREAITAANGNAASGGAGGECAAGQAAPTIDTVAFSIAGAGPHVIAPASVPPPITESVTIDGETDTNPGPLADEIRFDGASAGPAFGFDVEADDTTIHRMGIVNWTAGIDISGTDGFVVDDSLIGTDPAGTSGLGNGIGIRVGVGSAPGTNAEIRGNAIADSSNTAVFIGDPGSSGNVVAGNRMGTNPAGTAALGNGVGVRIADGGDSNTIGGPAPADRNLIAAGSTVGIEIANRSTSDRSTGNAITGNRIGTTADGESALGNFIGIILGGAVDSTTISANLISASTQHGIRIEDDNSQPVGEDGPTDTSIAGNMIGTDKDGATALGNGQSAIAFMGTGGRAMAGNVVGGTSGLTPGGACTGDCNVISASTGPTQVGVSVGTAGSDGFSVLGNHIGTDDAGVADLGNAFGGVSVSNGTGAVIGSPAGPNLISGNGTGVRLTGGSGTLVQANLIGTETDGSSPLPNSDHGVLIDPADGSLIGGTGPGEGNVIALNGADGVRIAGGSGDDAVLSNSITGNGILGINLFGAPNVDPNDPGDGDSGPNDLQNFPELRAAVADGSTVIAGELDSEASASYLVEAYSNVVADGSGNGEGETPLGSFTVTTDAGGEAAFATTVAGTAGAGEFVTATATRLDGSGNPLSTSEFAANVTEGCDVTGSPGDDAALTGTGADEVICGLGGDDVIDGGGGDDVIVGGPGTDEVDYSGAAAEIDADLVTGVVVGAGAGSDLVAEVEDVTGTDFDDEMLAGVGDNTLDGGDGEDTLESGDGDDTLKGRDGKDTLIAKDDKDKLRGGDGGDDLQGGGGDKDDLDGDDGKDSFDGGGGDKDDCDGGPDKDKKPAPGCEKKASIP